MHWTSHFCTIYKLSHNFTIKFKLLKYTTAIWCRIFAISIWLHLMKVWHDRFSTMVFRGGYKYRCELGRVYVLYSVFCRIHKMRMYLYGDVCVSLSRCVYVCVCMRVVATNVDEQRAKCWTMGKCWQTFGQYGERMCRTRTHTNTDGPRLINFYKSFYFHFFYTLLSLFLIHASVRQRWIPIYF